VSNRLDKRRHVIPAMLALTLCLGLALHVARDGRQPDPAPAASAATNDLGGARERLLHQRFQQAVALLQHGEYDYAVQGFHEVLEIAPDLPEAHVNMGFALLGLEQFAAARGFFDSASNLRPSLSNAYYGLAVAWEGLGDLRQAEMAMRTFVHIADENDPHRRKAEAAIWEWEAAIAAREND